MILKTPDVYVNEISTLAPSIAEVSTAIPAFIGYTEITEQNGSSLVNRPVRITSLQEYQFYFGGAYVTDCRALLGKDKAGQQTITIIRDPAEQHHLYYSLDHYFKNGGADCYVVSVGSYSQTKSKEAFLKGLDAVMEFDEPTLLIVSEACSISNRGRKPLEPGKTPNLDYYDVCVAALGQCGKLMDRFCILDVLQHDTTAAEFRDHTGTLDLRYGAAYYPYLNTSLNYITADTKVTVELGTGASYSLDTGGIRIQYSGPVTGAPSVAVVVTTDGSEGFDVQEDKLTISIEDAGLDSETIVARWEGAFKTGRGAFDLLRIEGRGNETLTTGTTALRPAASGSGKLLSEIKSSQTALYNAVKQELGKLNVVLPPASALAGVYASVDRERGVWKAPANVSINAVISPDATVTNAAQNDLNIDATSGKSVNAIRSFVGKGTLVWGARTLAGNDNEWKYIPVRRLFNMVEESAKKASYFAVFEPNDASTWLKVRGMLESYLYGLWQQGALAGSTPKAAYFVNVGLGTTMTQADILNGKLIIEIGLAAVRPAEFIILNFSHKLQEV